MSVLLVCPEIRLDSKPFDFPFWAGIFASIVEKKGGQVAILDLNALRMNYGGNLVPSEIIKNEISSAKWDLIGIGGLTTTYARMSQLIPFLRKYCPDSTIIAASPITSFKPPDVVQIRGTPQAMPSPAPKPKPSYKDGITAISAEEYIATTSNSDSSE